MSCEQCMLSFCLTPQYNVCSFLVLKRPPYLMVPVTVTTYWYDNYGLPVLKQQQDLMRSRRMVGLLILRNSALITTITTVTATVTVTIIVTVSLAAISLAQQVILPNILKNLILGVWDSSDVGLNLGKLHNQIQTMEHSQLDFTAAGAANDFFPHLL